MTREEPLPREISAVLAASPKLSAKELTAALANRGLKTDKSSVNSALYSHTALFWNDGGTPPRWQLASLPARTPSASRSKPSSRPADKLTRPSSDLYAWQAEALQAWSNAGHRGVVEAVTGTGKTMVGITAAIETLRHAGKVLIILPSIELLRQWSAQLSTLMPADQIGQLGDGTHSDWRSANVIVSVINSARAYDLGSPGSGALLIADECHRYGSASNARALDVRFKQRLGLSATYARSDGGNAEFLDPYFGGTCFRMDYRRAISDEVTAHFKVALSAVPFGPGEQARYDEANRAANKAQQWLIQGGHVRDSPFGDFMKDVAKLADGGHIATMKARSFLSNFTERRRVLAESSSKQKHLALLVPALKKADRSIVFTQTVEAADRAAACLRAAGLDAQAIHSHLGPDDRRTVLTRFAEGDLKAIVAPQVLDEGVDVPAADLAVILASSRTQRQMIQRMGRVLRRKGDGRLARFVVTYIAGSSEDPAEGAHEDFIEEITAVADAVQNFPTGTDPKRICAFLNDFAGPMPLRSPRMASPAGHTNRVTNAPRGSQPGSLKSTPSPGRNPGTGGVKPSKGAAPKNNRTGPEPTSKIRSVPTRAPSAATLAQVRQANALAAKKAAGPPVAAPSGMSKARRKRLYDQAGITNGQRRADLAPMMFRLGGLPDAAILHGLTTATETGQIESIARGFRPTQPSPPQGTRTPPSVQATAQPRPGLAQQKATSRRQPRALPRVRSCLACGRPEEACTCGR